MNMVRLDGNVLHEHEISNFTQNSVSHTGDAITTFNGTFSVSMREGIVNNVPGYIQFTGDLVSIWLDLQYLKTTLVQLQFKEWFYLRLREMKQQDHISQNAQTGRKVHLSEEDEEDTMRPILSSDLL
jgi:hypothetical protein